MTITADPLSAQTFNTFSPSMLVFMHPTYLGHQSEWTWFPQIAHLPVSAFKTHTKCLCLCTGSHLSLVLSGHHYSHSPLLSYITDYLFFTGSFLRTYYYICHLKIGNLPQFTFSTHCHSILCTSCSKNPQKQYLCSLSLISFLLISLKPASSSLFLNPSWKRLLPRLPMTSILLCPMVSYQSSSYLNC